MLAYKKTLEQEMEIEIARIQIELAQLEPIPALPVITLIDKNVISASFNSTASQTTERYLRTLPYRNGLISRLEFCKRRLHGLRLHKMHAANFAFAA